MRCQSFNKEFKAGDNLEFKQGNKTAGVFTVTWHHNCSVSSVSVEMFFVRFLLTSLRLRYELCIKDHLMIFDERSELEQWMSQILLLVYFNMFSIYNNNRTCPTFPIRLLLTKNIDENRLPPGTTKVEGLPQHDAILMLLAHKSQDAGQVLSFMFLWCNPSLTCLSLFVCWFFFLEDLGGSNGWV